MKKKPKPKKVKGAKGERGRSTKKIAKKRVKKTSLKKKVSKKTKAVKKPLRKGVKKATKRHTGAKRKTGKTATKTTMKAPSKIKGPKSVTVSPIKPVVPPVAELVPGAAVGTVTHYYSHLGVAVVELKEGGLQIGDRIRIKGHTTDFEQVVESMEVEHQPVQFAQPGQTFGMKVRDHAREHDTVYRLPH